MRDPIPEFMDEAEFARHKEIAKDAFSRVFAFELRISHEDARRRIDAASGDLDGYLRAGHPEFWMSIIRTRVWRTPARKRKAR